MNYNQEGESALIGLDAASRRERWKISRKSGKANYSTPCVFTDAKGRNLLTSYIRTRALSAAELGALPLLARGAALRFLLTRLVDWLNVPPGALVKPKDPVEYFRKLRFHQKVASVRDYGLAEERA